MMVSDLDRAGRELDMPPASQDDLGLVQALRSGDEAAFVALINRYHTSMVRIALIHVSDRAVAEEVVQETWLGVLQGLNRFEGRSSLKTWIFRILTNRAITRSEREGRSIPFSDLWSAEDETVEPAVEPERFRPPNAPLYPGGWAAGAAPQSWSGLPEERILSQETSARLQAAIAALPANQRQVITLRDVEGWESDEVCNVLGISETNQRVLLHRARSKVRSVLEKYLNGEQN